MAVLPHRFGDHHGLVGATLRAAGDVAAARGQDDEALAMLRRAVALTSAGYGASHPAARRAELALAQFEATHGQQGALARLDHLTALPVSDSELRKIAWRAQATAAALRCDGPRREESLAVFTALEQQVAMARPEGGVVVRELQQWRLRCPAPGD